MATEISVPLAHIFNACDRYVIYSLMNSKIVELFLIIRPGPGTVKYVIITLTLLSSLSKILLEMVSVELVHQLGLITYYPRKPVWCPGGQVNGTVT
jgi:hypothetical protein